VVQNQGDYRRVILRHSFPYSTPPVMAGFFVFLLLNLSQPPLHDNLLDMYPPLITLLTDFGTRDGYVGAMKGVIRSIVPHAQIDDITHDIPAGDIRSGAWALRGLLPLFPPHTIHVAVVDPGVGTERPAILLQAGDQFLIGPDNGLFSWILQASSCKAWVLSEDAWRPDQTSHTFHGRDLFSHAAALLARDGDLKRICETPLRPACGDWACLHPVQGETQGEILHLDRFGNAITNLQLPADPYGKSWKIELPEVGLRFDTLTRTYGNQKTGQSLALIGSHGLLEIAVRDGSAAAKHGLRIGNRVQVSPA